MRCKAVLCDIGGVLYVGNEPLSGAVEAVARLKAHFPVRFLTNTTQKTGAQVVGMLRDMGFDIEPYEVITALDMTRRFLENARSGACYLLTPDAEAFFSDLPSEPCRYVVVGDAQENFTYEKLNCAFRVLMEGGELIAAAKNRTFKDRDGKLSMDAGGFVSALEYAAQKEARILGKPSRDFYALACEMAGAEPGEVVMIGDDIESDVAGAQDAGLEAILVRTGKFSPADLERGITPDRIAEDFADAVEGLIKTPL